MRIQSINPLTGKRIAVFEPCSPQTFESVVSKANRYEQPFQKLGLEARAAHLRALAKLIHNKQHKITQAINTSVGKPIADAGSEVIDILAGIQLYLKRLPELRALLAGSHESGLVPDTDLMFEYQPVGTMGLIMPWNFPFWMPMGFIVPALLSGSPIILKPSPYAAPIGKLIEELVQGSGFAAEALQVVQGGPIVGNMVVNHQGIKRLAFVGSTDIGLHIAEQRVRQESNNFTLEMGGNSAAIVWRDAQVDNAVASIFWNGSYYAGQVCTGVKRVLVHDSLFDEVRDRLVVLADKYNQPARLVENVGAVISPEMVDQVEYRVTDAVKTGSKVLTGGQRVPAATLPAANQGGNFFPVTVVEVGDRHTDLVMKETFAPVLPLIRFRTIDEAVAIANETTYGLSANVFAENPETIRIFQKRLNAGMLFVNDSEVSYPGGNFWKGRAQSYLSTGEDDRLLAMYDKRLVWSKPSSVTRDYWFA